LRSAFVSGLLVVTPHVPWLHLADNMPYRLYSSYGVEEPMAKNFNELLAKMSPAARAEVERRVTTELAAMRLSEIRKQLGVTQEELAGRLGMKQASLSKLERRPDVRLSTLKRAASALGGTMEVRVCVGRRAFSLL
jgi:DNA-binding Xre family transcriptional regulator